MSSQIITKPLPYIALILAHLIWGINFVVAKVTLQEFPPMSLALLRFALASLFLAPFFFAQTKKIKIDKKDLPALIAVGVFIITLNIAFFFEGIKRTTAIDASVLTLIIPILSVIIGWLYFKEKIYLVNLAGVAAAFLGALIIIGLPQFFTGTYSTQMLLGNILIILASISWVIGAVISKKVLTKYPSLVVTAIAFMVGTVAMLVPAGLEYIKNPSWPGQITILGLMGLTYMTLLSSISAYFLFEWGLSKTTITAADLFQYIEPFIAAFLAVTILGEQLSTSFLTGAFLITIGVFLGTLAKAIHRRHHKAHRV
ncbi:MAG: Uncharacterized protein G01um10147_755 [Microgenomates group bacterium Gr01-1014_7]|nr:MAG: Uncharacterized protein G01um10147_755 [Microgenomates group bacterium Gr01-1014_7]